MIVTPNRDRPGREIREPARDDSHANRSLRVDRHRWLFLFFLFIRSACFRIAITSENSISRMCLSTKSRLFPACLSFWNRDSVSPSKPKHRVVCVNQRHVRNHDQDKQKVPSTNPRPTSPSNHLFIQCALFPPLFEVRIVHGFCPTRYRIMHNQPSLQMIGFIPLVPTLLP